MLDNREMEDEAMEFYEVINRRKTSREWSGREVAAETVERILGAGLKAPSNDHRRNWDYILLRGDDEKENALQFVKEWLASRGEIKAAPENGDVPQRMYAYAIPRQYEMLRTAPYVILPVFKAGPRLFQTTSVDGMNSLASAWCVIENIFLAAAAEGMACSVRIPVGNEGARLAEAVGVPEGHVIPCYIGLGYPKEDAPVVEQVERDLKDRLHFGRWQNDKAI